MDRLRSLRLRAASLAARRRQPPPSEAAGYTPWLKGISPHHFPTFNWDYAHLVAVRKALARVTTGECQRLILSMPPQHGKTSVLTVPYPVYRLACEPWLRVAVGAYNQTHANRFSRASRRIAARLLDLSRERKAVNEWETAAGGYYVSVGVGAGITGLPVDLCLIDDPHKNAEEAASAAVRERVWEWWTDSLFTRLSRDAAVILVQTRWHTEDLAGRLLKMGGWEYVCLPAVSPAGEALCPELHPIEQLEEARKNNPISFQALYQQQPLDLTGGFFRGLEKLAVHEVAPTPDQFARRVRGWDLACLVGGTKVTTLRGDVPIEHVRSGDYALTRSGYKRVLWAGLTKHTRDLVRMRLSTGAELVGTADHKIWTENRGWVELGGVVRGDYSLYSYGGPLCLTNTSAANPIPKSLSSRGCTIPGDRGRSITRRGGTTEPPGSSGLTPFTVPCGGITTATYRPATTSTMWTGITTTTPPATWRSYPEAITPSCTITSPRSMLGQMPTPSDVGRCRSGGRKRSTNNTHAFIAESIFNPAALTFRPSSVASVVAETTTGNCGVPVYDLEVEDAHEFFANGILVHNCTEAQSGADPDYTVGVLMGRHKDGTFWVLDVVRERLGPGGVRDLIRQTAAADGPGVQIRVEREGGASGKLAAHDIVTRDLAGYPAASVRTKGSKAERAEPFAAQVEAGNVRMVRTRHAAAVLDEMRSFPTGSHDDIVDACSLGFGEAARPPGGWSLGGTGGSW